MLFLDTFYDMVGGDLKEVRGRLMKDERIRKYLRMFPKDPSFEAFQPAFDAGDYMVAFRCAHTLKGLCANLGLGDLQRSSTEVCEALRPGVKPEKDITNLIIEMDKDYEVALEAINALDAQ